jgi:hypothetical protein
VPGFPIRTSSDQRSVDSSPRHIAASHVLHRLPVPRHPPCALKHLQTQKPLTEKNYTTTNHTPSNQGKTPSPHVCGLMLATTIHKSNTTPHHQVERKQTHPHTGGRPHRGHHHLRFPTTGRRDDGPVASKPNSVSDGCHLAPRITREQPGRRSLLQKNMHPNRTHYRCRPIQRIARETGNPTLRGPARVSWCSLERR